MLKFPFDRRLAPAHRVAAATKTTQKATRAVKVWLTSLVIMANACLFLVSVTGAMIVEMGVTSHLRAQVSKTICKLTKLVCFISIEPSAVQRWRAV